MKNSPYQFDEFFASGLEESVSPFLTPTSRMWGKNLALKSALSAAFFLAVSFAFSFQNMMLSHFFLSIVYFLVGVPALLDTIEDFKNLEINIDVLMTLSAFLSLAIGSGLEGALLLVLFEVSGAMEETVTNKAKGAIDHLHTLAPTTALIVAKDGVVFEKSVKEVAIGTKVLVKSGEIVPLDGRVIEGSSSVNLVHLTGESLPVPMHPGADIPAGARNLESALTIQITRTSSDSTLSRIIQLITQASEAKPKAQRFLDKFGKRYAPAVIILTFAFIFILPFLLSIPFLGIEGSIYRSLAFMIAASPCALIIATPTAYLSAISACARKGILLKGGITLDALASCKVVSFDKTGTLTTGELSCSIMQCLAKDPKTTNLEALGIAAALERHVVHPIASAILKHAEEEKAPKIAIEEFQTLPGYGLKAMAMIGKEKVPVAIGLPDFIVKLLGSEKGSDILASIFERQAAGELSALLLVKDELFLFRFTDTPRPHTKELLSKISSQGLESVMMTGDTFVNAKAVGEQLGIAKIYADLRPEQKLSLVAEMSQRQGLAMVGDGINDAPALARATVGISLGKIGSATAQDASDVILLNDDLHLLGWLFDKAHLTLRIVKQNLTVALAVIVIATTPALLGWVPLWLAVILHEGGTVLVGLNSLRLLKK